MSNATLIGAVTQNAAPIAFFDARVPAGFPSPALDHLEQKISLDTLLDIQAPHTYIVRVSGDSMQDVGIFDADLLIVSRAIPAKPADIVVASLNGEVFVKRFCRENQQLVLRSENPAYPPRYILEGDELLVWGVVTHSIRGHRQHG